MPKGTQAMRSDFQTHVDEMLLSTQIEDKKAEELAREQEMSELNSIASLENHPGWKLMKASFQKKIDDIRSGKTLEEAVLNAAISDAELGQLTRTTNLVAKELEILLTTVEGAAMARKEELDGTGPQ